MKTIGIRGALKKIGAVNIEVKNGYHNKYGFFELPDRGLMYFDTGDDRIMNTPGIMVRTAKHRKDYTGGPNEWWISRKLREMGYTIR
jgi:hypothetical protein